MCLLQTFYSNSITLFTSNILVKSSWIFLHLSHELLMVFCYVFSRTLDNRISYRFANKYCRSVLLLLTYSSHAFFRFSDAILESSDNHGYFLLPVLAKRCNFVATCGYCQDVLSVCRLRRECIVTRGPKLGSRGVYIKV